MSSILTPTMKQHDKNSLSPSQPLVDNIIQNNENKEEQTRTKSKIEREKRSKKRSFKERPKIPFLVDIKNNAKVTDETKDKTEKSNMTTPGTSTPKLTSKSKQ